MKTFTINALLVFVALLFAAGCQNATSSNTSTTASTPSTTTSTAALKIADFAGTWSHTYNGASYSIVITTSGSYTTAQGATTLATGTAVLLKSSAVGSGTNTTYSGNLTLTDTGTSQPTGTYQFYLDATKSYLSLGVVSDTDTNRGILLGSTGVWTKN